MEDLQIVELFWDRDESAISQTDEKYGRYLLKIAMNILAKNDDAEECVNDTYLRAWNSMPEHRPKLLSTYLGKITRQLSIDVFRRRNSKKRGSSQYEFSLHELEDCVGGTDCTVGEAEFNAAAVAVSKFLRAISSDARTAFVCRYYFMDSIKEIAAFSGSSEARIKSLLHRTRKQLKIYLESEGFDV